MREKALATGAVVTARLKAARIISTRRMGVLLSLRAQWSADSSAKDVP
jgi:hypothetical protein